MTSKVNNLNPVPVYGYHQHEDLQCNSPMSAAYCRIRSQNQLQTKYNKLHYPTSEGFQTMNTGFLDTIIRFVSDLVAVPTRLIEGMENDCSSIIKSKNSQSKHQLPSFGKSKVSPVDSTSNNKMVNELYLRQCFDSQYDGDVASTTLIQT